MKWPDWLLVFLGGGAGSVTRWLFSKLFDPILTAFPLATFISNCVACFILGFVFSVVSQKTTANNLWLLIGIGFCGGFSTFSSFTLSNIQMMQTGFSGIALINIFGSILICMLSLFCGMWLQKMI